MKFLVFIPCFTYGGAEKQAAILARYLHHKGHDVEVWGFPSPTTGAPLLADLTRDGIFCRVLPEWPQLNWNFHENGRLVAYLKHRFFLWPKQVKACERMIPTKCFDVVVPFTVMPCFTSVIFSKKICAGKIFWNHRGGYDNAGINYTKYIIKQVLKKNPVMLANSEAGAKYLVDTFKLPHDKVSVVHNIIMHDESLSQIAEQRVYERHADKPIQLLHLANMFKEKDLLTVLSAVRQLKDIGFFCHLHVAGFSPSQNELLVFKQSISGNGLDETVTYHGIVDNEQRQTLLRMVDIGLLSSRSEGLPNSVMEYMYSALPVVGTDIPGIRELLGEGGVSCLFPVGNPDSLAKLVFELGRDPILRKTLGQSNRSRILSEFSSEKILPEWEKILGCDSTNLSATPAICAGS